MKNVDTLHYFPAHISRIEEFQKIAKAYDTELRLLWTALGKQYQNQYFDTMDEATCERWEKLIGINVMPGSTLTLRRMMIKGRWASSLPYTLPKFHEVLQSMVGDQYRLSVSVPNKTLTVSILLSEMSNTNDVYEMMRAMAPADMDVTVGVAYNRWQRFRTETWGTLQPYTWNSLKEDVRWEE